MSDLHMMGLPIQLFLLRRGVEWSMVIKQDQLPGHPCYPSRPPVSQSVRGMPVPALILIRTYEDYSAQRIISTVLVQKLGTAAQKHSSTEIAPPHKKTCPYTRL